MIFMSILFFYSQHVSLILSIYFGITYVKGSYISSYVCIS
nr:MAG TPA: hypothetical protein [Caudoviricetes sp.]